jgi:MSHA pilin protein MshD
MSSSPGFANARRAQRGVSLIELVIFIVVIAAGLMGILSAMNLVGSYSSDPAIQRQELALAESLLTEVELQPFTKCDPLGPPATPGGACLIAQGLGPANGETRYSTTAPFNNVGDYNGFTMNASNGGILAIDGTAVGGLAGYSASVQVQANQSLGALPTASVLLVTVTVGGPDGSLLSISGYRTLDPQ